MSVIKIIFVGVVVNFIVSRRTDIGMPVCNGDIGAYIGFCVVNVKARGVTTSQGTRRGAAIRYLTLRQ